MERGLRKSANVGTDQIRCQYCGSIHKRGPSQCPAYGQRCRYCKRLNHFESQCQQKQDRKRERFVRAVTDFEDEDSMMQETNMLSIEESQVDLLESDILMVSAHQSEVSDLSYPNKLFIHLVLQEKTIRFQVDTGASCDILRVEELRDRTMLQPTRQRLRLYDGTVVAPVGQIRLEVTNPKTKQRYNCEFIVVSGAAVSLIGAKTSLAMGLLKIEYQNIANTDAIESEQAVSTREDVVTRYHDVFSEELGHLGGDLHLELDPQVTPVQLPVRKIPLALQEHLQVELQELEERGIIVRVDVPTD